MPAETSSRTLVLSVVAVDLVGYSRESVAGQMTLKDNFNQVLVRAIQDIAIADRIILDTGDGVAMGFLGDPEDALYVAMFMHDALNRDRPAIRIGINLGPVKLATGVRGHPNIIGDGINVAERIMTFAEPGQCTVSRPYFEMMSRVSGKYKSLFEFAGVRTDKQVRDHDVYVVGKSLAAFSLAEQGVKERVAQRISQAVVAATPPAQRAKPALSAPRAASGESHSGLIDFLEDRKKVTTVATLLAVIAVGLGATLAWRMTQAPESSAPLVAAANSATANPQTAGPASVVPAPAAAAPIGKTPGKTSGKTPSSAAVPPSAPLVAAKAAPKVETKVSPTTTPATRPAPAATPVPAPVPAPTAPAATRLATTPPAALPGSAREKPQDAKIEKTERVEKAIPREPIREEPRKPQSRTGVEREQSAPVGAAPVVPAFQAPQQAPRTESVAPTPAPAPVATPVPVPAKPASAPSTEAIVVSRSAPPFPIEGARQGIQTGFVKARLTIDARGNVTNVDILEAKPIAAFGRETRLTLKDWKFNPGTPNRSYEIEISFKL